jgi:exodeoxyribonuclease VII large subunit
MSDIPFEVDLADPESGKKGRKATGKKDTGKKDAGKKGGGKKEPGEDSPQSKVWTVSRLTRHIRQLLEGELPHVVVEGEVSNTKQAASGHLYFNLKDDGAQIRCIMFRNAAQGLRFTLEDGLQVVLRGRISVYEARGEYQIQALTLDPQGTGALQLAFEQLKAKLEKEGLFAAESKQDLPYLPRRIGIVTSATGAAIRDMLHVLERRFPGLPVLIHPAAVQGEAAAGEIAQGIAALNRLATEQKIDVIIVGRGGGSVEDLWAFNEEAVARAIFASQVPVISAVGHEVDFTIADFVADVRAPTPSAAAEIAVPNRADLLATVADLRERLIHRMQDEVELGQERWESLRARLGSPEAAIAQVAQRVDDYRERVETAARRILVQARQKLQQATLRLRAARPDRFNRLQRDLVRGLEAQLRPALASYLRRLRDRLGAQSELLDSLSPLTVMKRGYGALQDSAGKLLRSVREVKPGDALKVRLQDGALDTEVKSVHEEPVDDR